MKGRGELEHGSLEGAQMVHRQGVGGRGREWQASRMGGKDSCGMERNDICGGKEMNDRGR